MTPVDFFRQIVQPYADLLPFSAGVPNSKQSRLMLMAIAGHETGWSKRRQIPGGEARGYWQCEKGGGVTGVLTHPRSGPIVHAFCAARDIPSDIASVFEAIAWHDALALIIARLILWLDPAALPTFGDESGAREYYLKNWRPGIPHEETWGATYAQSVAVVV